MQVDLDKGARNALLSKYFHQNLTSGQNRLLSYHRDQNQLEIELSERHLDFQTCPELDRDVVNSLLNALNKRFTNCNSKLKRLLFQEFPVLCNLHIKSLKFSLFLGWMKFWRSCIFSFSLKIFVIRPKWAQHSLQQKKCDMNKQRV